MFPNGWPGAGLLLLRLVCGAFIVADGAPSLVSGPNIQTLILESIALLGALLLIVGFWTPFAGVFIVLIEFWLALSRTNSFENSVLLATLGAALTVLGPGSHSIDAKRYGRKNIDIPND